MTKLSRKERMQKAEEMAGISFWVDLRKGRLSKYTIQKKIKSIIAALFRYVILICLGFVVITPIWKLAKDAFTDPAMLGDKSSTWIPLKTSSLFLEMAASKSLLEYGKSLIYSLLTTAVLTFLQVLSTGLAAYSFARLKFKGSNILFFFVVLTIVVPGDSLMLAQYAAFRNFDISGSILTVSVLSFLWNYTDTYYTGLLNPSVNHLAYRYSSLQANVRWGIDTAAKSNAEWLSQINASNPFVQTSSISACALLVVLPLLVMYCFVQKRFVQGAARSGLGGD